MNELEIKTEYISDKKTNKLNTIKIFDRNYFVKNSTAKSCVETNCPFYNDSNITCSCKENTPDNCSFPVWNDIENDIYYKYSKLNNPNYLATFIKDFGSKELTFLLDKELLLAIIEVLEYGKIVYRFNPNKGHGIFEILNNYNRTYKYFSRYDTKTFIKELMVEAKKIVMRFNLIKSLFQSYPSKKLKLIDKSFQVAEQKYGE